MLTDEFFLGTKLYNQKLFDFCKPMVKYLGVTHVIYVNIDKTGKIFSVCSDQKWMSRLLEEKYYIADPLMVHPNNIHNGFAFDESSQDQEFKDTLLYDAVIKYNWCNSFAYIEKTPEGGYFGFDFGTTKENFHMINKLINSAPIVKKLIRNINRRLLAETLDLQEAKIDFASLKGDIFYSQKGLVFNEQDISQNKLKVLQDLKSVTGRNNLEYLINVQLSPQEISCLRLYYASNSIKSVARDLNLAVTTVTSYIENIKNKLRCNNKIDLFERAEILGSLGKI